MADSSESKDNKTVSILVFTPHPGVAGGVVNFSNTLIRHLNRNFTADRFIIGQRPSLWGRVLRPIMPIIDTAKLVLVLMTGHHDIYHLNPSFNARSIVRDGLFLLTLRIFRRHRVLVFFHGWTDTYYSRLVNSRIRRALFRFVFSHPARIIVLADAFRSALISLGVAARKIRVMTTMFDAVLLQRPCRQRKDEDIRLLTMSRLVREKGIHELLNAFAQVSRVYPNVTLTIAGDGPEYARASGWIREIGMSERISMPGHVTGNRKAQLLDNADIFVLPSYHGEGCPVALLEAMAAGLAVIATPIGGIPDIVRNGVNGIVINEVTPSAIADALVKLIRNPTVRDAMGQQNRQQAWAKYEASKVVGRIADEYTRLSV